MITVKVSNRTAGEYACNTSLLVNLHTKTDNDSLLIRNKMHDIDFARVLSKQR